MNIASFEDLTKEESISSENVALILLSIFLISSVSSVYFYYLLGTHLCDIIYFFTSGHSDVQTLSDMWLSFANSSSFNQIF